MNKYAGTQTEKNLQAAFAGESQARNKYTYFASVAKKEGYEQISSLFLKYTYKVALLYPAAFAISSIEVDVIPFSINNTDAAAAIFSLCALIGSFFLRPISCLQL